jgi:hypothetical protein
MRKADRIIFFDARSTLSIMYGAEETQNIFIAYMSLMAVYWGRLRLATI